MGDLFIPATFNSKVVQFDVWQAGLFGNMLRTWNSLKEIESSGYRGTLSMRYKGDVGGKWTKYNVNIHDVAIVQQEWISQGAELGRITFNESAPDTDLVVQGEVMHCDSEKRYVDKEGFGLFFRYSCKPMKMRDALKTDQHHAWRLEARMLLERFLTPASYSDISELLEYFPGHSVEFSTYRYCLGNIPGRNTIFWEVRKY